MEHPTNVIYHAPRRPMLEVIPEELAPGLVAGDRFCLERRLGAGGMGEVWAARHVVTRKSVALKFLKPSRAADARSRARIVLEARAASAVQHPNVVQVHDVGELESGLPFLVMDLLEGETLAAKLSREHRLSVMEAARTLLPVVDAVRAAHAAGVVHRDLKPENVFLTPADDGATKVLVLDFGIAKLLDGVEEGASGGLTATGEVLGSSLYMAPEQIYAESDVDGRVDVWALGVILYEVLSGTRPTQRASSGQVLKAITVDEIVPLARLQPDVPAPLARVVMKMLSRDRGARPDLDAVAEVLTRPAGAPKRTRWVWGLVPSAALVASVVLGRQTTAPPAGVGPAAGRSAVSPSSPTLAMAPSAPSGEPPVVPTSAVGSTGRVLTTARAAPSSAHAPPPVPSASPLPQSSVATPAGSNVVLTLDRK